MNAGCVSVCSGLPVQAGRCDSARVFLRHINAHMMFYNFFQKVKVNR